MTGYQLADALNQIANDTRDEKRAEVIRDAAFELARLVREVRELEERLEKFRELGENA